MSNLDLKNMFEDYPDIVGVDEITEMLRIGRNRAYALLNRGEISSIRIGSKHRIPKQAIINYILCRQKGGD